ncbi:hypothetical protein ACFC26_16035 [Kitasatospora purpeofusca]|uniref:hypothetical protein n=1 Tax=Kitasatospora purpeofusca TaxID=67352 RepID=UPI0035D68D2F
MTSTDDQEAARRRLAELSAAYAKAEEALDEAREALNVGIVDVLMTRALGPSEVARIVPYERQHVGRIAKAGGVPPLRERTVVSAKPSAEPPTS